MLALNENRAFARLAKKPYFWADFGPIRKLLKIEDFYICVSANNHNNNVIEQL